jgi:Sulfotransferase family
MTEAPSRTESRTQHWTPPTRPDWVQRINEEGSFMDIQGIVPLDERSLIDQATASTGLQDFGDDNWREPFQVLVKALNDEAQLNLMGRLMTRSDLLLYLQARLRIEQAYNTHPEIEDQQIIKPLLIVGQARSGTSFLHNVLTKDPNNATPRAWEVLYPEPSEQRTDTRVERAQQLITQQVRVVPEISAMHEYGATVPTESVHLHGLSFRSAAWFDAKLGQTPSYAAYMASQDPAEAYRYEKRLLKLLQWKNPRTTWVLKSPYTLNHLPSVLEVYPDIGVIWTHRDPVKAVASLVNLIGSLQWVRSDHPFQGHMLAVMTDASQAAKTMSRPIEWLESGRLPSDRLCHLQYGDLTGDAMAVVEQIYRSFDIALTDEGRTAMSDYLADSPRSSRPKHDYDLGSDELRSEERDLFEPYQTYFHVPNEV